MWADSHYSDFELVEGAIVALYSNLLSLRPHPPISVLEGGTKSTMHVAISETCMGGDDKLCGLSLPCHVTFRIWTVIIHSCRY